MSVSCPKASSGSSTTASLSHVVPCAPSQRVSVHSHIKGLGLRSDGSAEPIGGGLVGQCDAREAAGLVVELIKAKKMAGKALLFAGPTATGKTAIALGLARELGPTIPFCAMTGSEVYSAEVKKTEILMEYFRKAIGIRIRETKEVYEGEITELIAEETENPHGNFGKSISAVIISLKTNRGTKTLRLSPDIHNRLVKEKVRVGDVIYIDSNSGGVVRCGRCDAYNVEYDIEMDEYVSLPKGDVYKKKEIVQDLCLYDIDVANSKPLYNANNTDILSLLNNYVRPKKTEITDKLRLEVNKIINKYIDSNVASIIPGVLFIDEVHMLDLECFTFLNRCLESTIAPIVIFATNRGVCSVRGIDEGRSGADKAFLQPHGMPVDLLDRLLIIKTSKYSVEDIINIINIRSKINRIDLSKSALNRLGELGMLCSLRYAIGLIEPSYIYSGATQGEQNVVDIEHVNMVDELFMDAKSSAQRVINDNGASFIQ